MHRLDCPRNARNGTKLGGIAANASSLGFSDEGANDANIANTSGSVVGADASVGLGLSRTKTLKGLTTDDTEYTDAEA